MKILIPIALFFLSALVLGQIDLKTGDQIKSGKLTLTNGETIPFYSLEYGADERISYVNTQNLEAEFLYVNSIKSIETTNLSEGEISTIESKLKKEQNFEIQTFKTITYKDKSIELTNPSPGKSVIYFVRTNGSGYLINFRHFDYDKFIGKFAGAGFIRYECDPGEHVFWVGASNSSYVTANLEEGKIYVIETIPVMGMAYARVKIEIPNRMDSKKYAKQKKRIFAILEDKKLDKTNSKDELYSTQSDYEKEIKRGLEIYQKRSEKEQDHLLDALQYFE